jgi:hypothetical protein
MNTTLNRIKKYNINIDLKNKHIKRYINNIEEDLDDDIYTYGYSIIDFDFVSLKENFMNSKLSKIKYLEINCKNYPNLIEKEKKYWDEFYDEKNI